MSQFNFSKAFAEGVKQSLQLFSKGTDMKKGDLAGSAEKLRKNLEKAQKQKKKK